MPETTEHVNVMLQGRLPTLRQEIKQLTLNMRKLRTKDGQVIVISYLTDAGDSRSASIDKYAFTTGNEMLMGESIQITNMDSQAKAETLFGTMLREESPLRSMSTLALTKVEVINQPRVQSLIQSMGHGARLGVVIEEEPEKITLTKLEAALKKWIPVWATATEERESHPPFLALRQRLIDEATGRLDSSKIARLFNLSTAEMGAICGVSKQSIHANPTSKGIQEKLEPLVRAARGILWCGGDEAKFKAWLNQPNPDFPEYQGRQLSPLDMIRMGHVQVIADKVQNLLTGHPA